MDKNKLIPNRPALGKGLASLLPGAMSSGNHSNPIPASVVDSETNKDRLPGITMCPVEHIVPNQYQPRKSFDDESVQELADSIKANGLIQPLIVRKAQVGYQLIAGERRWRAAKLAGLNMVPVVVRRSTDKEALEVAIIENIQREDLNCIDTALAYQQLMTDFNLTQEDVSKKMGKDRATIANHLRLLKLPSLVVNALKSGTLSYGHGRTLAALDDVSQIEKIADQAIDEKWSVRQLEAFVANMKNEANLGSISLKKEMTPVDVRLKNLSKDLSHKLGAKTSIKGNEKKGKFVIEYFSDTELDKILTFLMRN